MAEFKYDPEAHIVIDGKAYERSGLSDEVVSVIQAINATDSELNGMVHNLNVYRAGRDAMVRDLITRLDSVPVLGTVEQKEAEAREPEVIKSREPALAK